MRFLAVLALLASAPAGALAQGWVQLTPDPPRPIATAGSVAYDPVRDVVVHVSGELQRVQTWEWDGQRWRAFAPQNPPTRALDIVFDPVRKQVMTYDGDALRYWDGSEWTVVETTTDEKPAWCTALAFDEAREVAVCFDGNDKSVTWTFDGSAWTQAATVGPSPRGTQLVYDAARERVVMVGGFSFQGSPWEEMWEWDGSSWSRMTVTDMPPADQGYSVSYDVARDRIVLIPSAFATDGSPMGHYELDGSAWIKIERGVMPRGRSFSGTTYDSKRQRVLVFGGVAPGVIHLDDLWSWDGSTWTELLAVSGPAPRYQAAMVHDPVRQRTVLVGGDGAGATWVDTWLFDGSVWTQAEDFPARNTFDDAALVWRQASERVLLIGGGYSVWEWDGAEWSYRSTSGAPPRRSLAAVGYDPIRDRVVVFGGTLSYADTAETWELDPTTWSWEQKLPATAPSPRSGAKMAYDVAGQRLLLAGGRVDADELDLWTWDGSDWSQVSTAEAPPARSHFGLAYDRERQRVVVFGGLPTRSYVPLADTWELDGDVWQKVETVAAPAPLHSLVAAYDDSLGQVLLMGGADDEGSYQRALWAFDPSFDGSVDPDEPGMDPDAGMGSDAGADPGGMGADAGMGPGMGSGCGCRAGTGAGLSSLALVALVALGLSPLARRRRIRCGAG